MSKEFKSITIHFEHHDIPQDSFVAWIEDEDYKGMVGMVVSGNSIGECVQEIGTSLKVLELYKENTQNNSHYSGESARLQGEFPDGLPDIQ